MGFAASTIPLVAMMAGTRAFAQAGAKLSWSKIRKPSGFCGMFKVSKRDLEERPGLHLCAFWIGRDVRDPIGCGACVVLFSNAEELNRKHPPVVPLHPHKCSSDRASVAPIERQRNPGSVFEPGHRPGISPRSMRATYLLHASAPRAICARRRLLDSRSDQYFRRNATA